MCFCEICPCLLLESEYVQGALPSFRLACFRAHTRDTQTKKFLKEEEEEEKEEKEKEKEKNRTLL